MTPCPACGAHPPHGYLLHDPACPELAAATLAAAGWHWTSKGSPRGDEEDPSGREADRAADRYQKWLESEQW